MLSLCLNFVVGRSETIDELFGDGLRGYLCRLRCRSADLYRTFRARTLNGVYSANEYLTRINLMKAYKENADTPI